MPRLRLKQPAEEQLAALPSHIRDELDVALLEIQANPTEAGDQLVGRLTGKWRKKVSGYRIIYVVREGGNLAIVESIRPRNRRTYN